jgi:hypothetical protein
MTTLLKISLTNKILIALLFVFFATGCLIDNNDDPSSLIWDEDWLVGTWEGTTPTSVQPFGGKKISIVFKKANHFQTDSVQGNVIKNYFYDGTFTWDTGGSKWSTSFNAGNYPDPGVNTINWQGTHMTQAKTTMNIMSIRIGDIEQTDPWHSFDLDWGPFMSTSSKPPTTIELYGDIEIESNGELERADYPPSANTMIKLTKK